MTGQTAVEKRVATSLYKTLYAMAHCYKCHEKCAQERGAWYQQNGGGWVEARKCAHCKKQYAVPLLPFEIRRAEKGKRHA